jgi:hypothetical protein
VPKEDNMTVSAAGAPSADSQTSSSPTVEDLRGAAAAAATPSSSPAVTNLRGAAIGTNPSPAVEDLTTGSAQSINAGNIVQVASVGPGVDDISLEGDKADSDSVYQSAAVGTQAGAKVTDINGQGNNESGVAAAAEPNEVSIAAANEPANDTYYVHKAPVAEMTVAELKSNQQNSNN